MYYFSVICNQLQILYQQIFSYLTFVNKVGVETDSKHKKSGKLLFDMFY